MKRGPPPGPPPVAMSCKMLSALTPLVADCCMLARSIRPFDKLSSTSSGSALTSRIPARRRDDSPSEGIEARLLIRGSQEQLIPVPFVPAESKTSS